MYSIFLIMALGYPYWTMFGNIIRRWKPKGSMYSLKCAQCGKGFLSSLKLDAPICGKCLQKVKSLDSTVDQDRKCSNCGKNGVLYGKTVCHRCYFGFSKPSEGGKREYNQAKY
jgi:hypothetical protein